MGFYPTCDPTFTLHVSYIRGNWGSLSIGIVVLTRKDLVAASPATRPYVSDPQSQVSLENLLG